MSSPCYQNYSSPGMGVGEQQNHWTSPKPVFPLQIQSNFEEEPEISVLVQGATPTTLSFRPSRQLSTFDEESETESLSDLGVGRATSVSPHGSPILSPRSRRLHNARSSPNIFLPTSIVSKSDHSDDEDEEEDDDIVELMTSSGRFPKSAGAFSRVSPSNSPLLTSRRSPTHTWTGSSDEEVASIFEATRKHRNKRLPYRRRSIPKLARVDSVSSDDGSQTEERKRRSTNRQKLLRMRQYNSLPATPAETSASESLTEILENMRRARSSSNRTDSSLSDGGNKSGGEKELNELANSMVTRFDISDEEGERSIENCMDVDGEHRVKRDSSVRTYSVLCCIL